MFKVLLNTFCILLNWYVSVKVNDRSDIILNGWLCSARTIMTSVNTTCWKTGCLCFYCLYRQELQNIMYITAMFAFEETFTFSLKRLCKVTCTPYRHAKEIILTSKNDANTNISISSKAVHLSSPSTYWSRLLLHSKI